MIAFQGKFIQPETSETLEGFLIAENGRIRELSSKAPRKAETLKLPGWVIPGLIDAHLHLCSDGDPNPNAVFEVPTTVNVVRAVSHLQRYLAAGVTTVRDLGGQHALNIHLRQALEMGLLAGPRVLTSGRNITITGGHGHRFGIEADGEDGVRAAARGELKAGADLLKFMATGGVVTQGVKAGASAFTEAEMRAGIEEARKVGKRTAAHAQGLEGIKNALRAGINTVEHGAFDAWDEEALGLMRQPHVTLVPTLAAPDAIWQGRDSIPAWVVEKTRPILEIHRATTLEAYRAGVRIAAGTDAGTPLNRHGHTARELELLFEVGVTRADVLRATTVNAAKALGMAGQIGTFAPGAFADLVALERNPLRDVGAYRRVARVVQHGTMI